MQDLIEQEKFEMEMLDCLNSGRYSDWRMPTQDELAGLYDKSKG